MPNAWRRSEACTSRGTSCMTTTTWAPRRRITSTRPPAIQATHGCGFDLNRLGGGDLSATIQTLALYIRAQSGKYPTGDWRTAPAPPAQPNAPPICGGAVDCPPLRLGPPGDPANPG